MSQMIKGYLSEIEGLRAKLVESESIVVQLRKDMSRANKLSPRNDNSSLSESGIEEVLDIAKRDVQKDLESIKSKQMPPAPEISPSDSGTFNPCCELLGSNYSWVVLGCSGIDFLCSLTLLIFVEGV